MASRKFTIQYRYLKEENLPKESNLKSMIVSALRSSTSDGNLLGKNARARIIDLDQDGSYVILNKITDPSSWSDKIFSGQLIHLQNGADVAAVLQSLEEDAEEYLLEQINLGDRSNVLKGVLYFVTVDNHVGILESQTVKGRTLERYLTSLLQAHGDLEPGDVIMLNSSFRATDGKQLKEAKTLTISAEPNYGASSGAMQQAVRMIEDHAAKVQREGSTVFDVLRTLGWDQNAIERLKGEVPQDGWIEGLFNVFIKRRGKRATISRAAIDEALRNIDPEDIGISGDGREKGGMVKLAMQRSIKTIGTLQDPSDAVEQIVNALRDWAMSGKIDCTFGDER